MSLCFLITGIEMARKSRKFRITKAKNYLNDRLMYQETRCLQAIFQVCDFLLLCSDRNFPLQPVLEFLKEFCHLLIDIRKCKGEIDLNDLRYWSEAVYPIKLHNMTFQSLGRNFNGLIAFYFPGPNSI